MHITIQVLLAIAAWRWGDWKHWKSYYPTILFLIIGDLLYNFVNYNFTLWKFQPDEFENSFYRNHTLISLGIYVLGYPSLVLLYLGHYPNKKIKQFFYVGAFIIAFTAIEAVSHFIVHGINYANGWNFGFSILFFIFVFIILRIHHLHPLLAWVISAVISIVWICFGVPIENMK